MVVPTCFMIAAWTYALCVNFVPSYRNPADKIAGATIGIENSESTGDVASDVERVTESDIEKGTKGLR